MHRLLCLCAALFVVSAYAEQERMLVVIRLPSLLQRIPASHRRKITNWRPQRDIVDDLLKNMQQGPWFQKPMSNLLKPLRPIATTVTDPNLKPLTPVIDPNLKPLTPVVDPNLKPLMTPAAHLGEPLLWKRLTRIPSFVKKVRSTQTGTVYNEYAVCFSLDQIPADPIKYFSSLTLHWKTPGVQQFMVSYENHGWASIDASMAPMPVQTISIWTHTMEGKEHNAFKSMYLAEGRLFIRILTANELVKASFEIGSQSYKGVSKTQQMGCPKIATTTATTTTHHHATNTLAHMLFVKGSIIMGAFVLVMIVVCIILGVAIKRGIRRSRERRRQRLEAARMDSDVLPTAPAYTQVNDTSDAHIVYVPVYYPQHQTPGASPVGPPPAYSAAPVPMYPTL